MVSTTTLNMSLQLPSLAKLQQATAIVEKIQALENELAALLGNHPSTTEPKAPKAPKGKRGKRKMSPEGRARIAAAQKARWAKFKGHTATAKPVKVKKARKHKGA